MLIKLKDFIAFNAAIRPICLPEQSAVATNEAIVSGWGLDRPGHRSDVLLKVTLELFSHGQCNGKYAAYAEFVNGIDEETQLCAGWMKGLLRKDACHGDSGGPIQIPKDNNGCIYTIVGVTSLGPRDCGTKDHPSVYTRVYPYLDWIEQNVWPGHE